MIAKITRGSSAKGLAAYLHGPGLGTEHQVLGTELAGGQVIASNVPGVDQATDGKRWGRWLDRAAATRGEIKNPIWHCSLNLAPGDRALTVAEWQRAATGFLQEMDVPEANPWVAVQHDERGIHIAVSRVDDQGKVWHARQDRRQAQRARQWVEKTYQLEKAPVRKDSREPLPTVRPGVYEVEGKKWWVRQDPQNRGLVADRLGQDQQWRPVTGGIRTLRQAQVRQDPAAAKRLADYRQLKKGLEAVSASFPKSATEATRTKNTKRSHSSSRKHKQASNKGRGYGR